MEEKVSIDDALSKLKKKVAEEEEDLMVAAMIEKLAKKTERKRRKKEFMEELRAEIAEYDEANKSVARDRRQLGQRIRGGLSSNSSTCSSRATTTR